MQILEIYTHPYNTIASTMVPYLYAIGALLGAIATPLIFKFILHAPFTNCVNHTTNEDSCLATEAQATNEQPWLMPVLFTITTIASSIACHSNNHWSQIIVNLLFTWTLLAEIFIQTRLNSISNWLPIILIWLGLLTAIDPNNTSSTAEKAVVYTILTWTACHILIQAAKDFNQEDLARVILYPTIIATLSNWTNSVKTTLLLVLIGLISHSILSTVEHLSTSIMKKVSIKSLYKPKILLIPTNAWLLIITWVYIFQFNGALNG